MMIVFVLILLADRGRIFQGKFDGFRYGNYNPEVQMHYHLIGLTELFKGKIFNKNNLMKLDTWFL